MPDHPTFYVHEKVDNDLESIFDYSVAQFRGQYVYDIEQTFKDLVVNPKLGKRFDPDINRYFQCPVESRCIFYTPTEKGVEIFRILHKSMLPTLHL